MRFVSVFDMAHVKRLECREGGHAAERRRLAYRLSENGTETWRSAAVAPSEDLTQRLFRIASLTGRDGHYLVQVHGWNGRWPGAKSLACRSQQAAQCREVGHCRESCPMLRSESVPDLSARAGPPAGPSDLWDPAGGEQAPQLNRCPAGSSHQPA